MIIRDLGVQPYQPVWAGMQQFTAQRQHDSEDELWLLEHPPVFTLGRNGKAEHLLDTGDIPVVQTDRGGQVTYHGPGQLVVYLMIDLTRHKLGVRTLVDVIEQSIVRTLAEFGIAASPRPDAPGVYVDEAKIASLGLRVKRGCSFHGLALNVAMDMEPFRRINPCGYAGLAMCQVSDFVPDVDISAVTAILSRELSASLANGDIHRLSA